MVTNSSPTPATAPVKPAVDPAKMSTGAFKVDGIRDRRGGKQGSKRTNQTQESRTITPEKIPDEQLEEIHYLRNILIKALHACEVVIYFMKETSGDESFNEKRDEIVKSAIEVKSRFKGKTLTLNDILSIHSDIKSLALDIQLSLITTEISQTDEGAQKNFEKYLAQVITFGEQDEILGTREVPLNELRQESQKITNSAGIKILRPTIMTKVNNDPASVTVNTQTPQEIETERLAKEAERNKNMFERASRGEEMTVEKLKGEGYTETEASDFLGVLKMLDIIK